jgi:hypothetical protein
MKTSAYILYSFVGLASSGCAQDKQNKSIDTYENVKKELSGVDVSNEKPKGDIEEFEMEVNNGGLNQYFLNAGQNCFETLRELQKTKKVKTAAILQRAIALVNPNKLSEKDLIAKLRSREVEELFNEKISEQLSKLDEEFYKYLDGALIDTKNISN